MNTSVHTAIKDTRDFIIPFMPKVGETTVFNLGYGRLKLYRYADNKVMCMFILPHKKNPVHSNMISLSPNEIIEIAFCKLA